MSKVYRIIEFDMLDNKKLYTCEECPDIEERADIKNPNQRNFYWKGTNVEALKSHRWKYSTKPKEGAIDPTKERFMPYFATVIEDVPGWVQKKDWAKTYENCQLLSEKHNGYMEFWHEPTQKTLRIALNSHIYQPIK